MADRKIYTKMPKNYYNYFDICKWEGIPTGTAKSAIGKKGLEGIASIEKLKPIAHQFKEFPKYENGMLRSQYGILKSNYDFGRKMVDQEVKVLVDHLDGKMHIYV